MKSAKEMASMYSMDPTRMLERMKLNTIVQDETAFLAGFDIAISMLREEERMGLGTRHNTIGVAVRFLEHQRDEGE